MNQTGLHPSKRPQDGFAVLDAVIAAALASLFAIALMGGVRHLMLSTARLEAKAACWDWAQALLTSHSISADMTGSESGTTPDGKYRWTVSTRGDDHDAVLERIDVSVASVDGRAEAKISTRRLRQ